MSKVWVLETVCYRHSEIEKLWLKKPTASQLAKYLPGKSNCYYNLLLDKGCTAEDSDDKEYATLTVMDAA